jgi:hypothetical protein
MLPTRTALTAAEKARKAALMADMLGNFDERVEYVRLSTLMQRRVETPYLRATAAVDRKKMSALQKHYSKLDDEAFATSTLSAYTELDVVKSLQAKARYIANLRLDVSPPLKILDLSMGGGHFAFLATQYGHTVTGIDADIPIYSPVLDMYGLNPVTCAITPRGLLPVTGKFDLIVAVPPTFNRHGGSGSRFWMVAEWLQFIEYLSTLIEYPGRIFLALGRYYYMNGQRWDVTDELMDFFDRHRFFVNYANRSILLKIDNSLKLSG